MNSFIGFARPKKLVVLCFFGWSFLWPYYQRAFFRVTLFYRLDDLSELCYGLFLVVFLIGAVALAFAYRSLEKHLFARRSSILFAGILSLVTTLYLAGFVTTNPNGIERIITACFATVIYACTLLVISGSWFLLLMRLVYTKGLFSAVIVLAGSGVAGCMLSPTSITSLLSTIIVPLSGLLISGLCAWFALEETQVRADSKSHQSILRAPYLKAWLIPLLSYFFFSILHAMAFMDDATTEVHVLDGRLSAASSLYSQYGLYFLFSLIVIIAAIQSVRLSLRTQEKITLWVAAMGISIGIFVGYYAAGPLAGLPPNDALILPALTNTFTVLLSLTVLFMTYQNRLSPLQSFGFFLMGAYAAEKVLAYLIVPYVIAASGAAFSMLGSVIDILVRVFALCSLLVFFIKLCHTDSLRLLFASSEDYPDHLSAPSQQNNPRIRACGTLAKTYGLTDREFDILTRLSLGYSAKRIGESFCISERTVQTHVQNIYRKLGVHSRQAVIDNVEEIMAQSCDHHQ